MTFILGDHSGGTNYPSGVPLFLIAIPEGQFEEYNEDHGMC